MHTHVPASKRQFGQTLGITDYQYHYHVKPDLHYYFPSHFTGMVDTFPVRVSQPEDSALSSALFNPKYGSFPLGALPW